MHALASTSHEREERWWWGKPHAEQPKQQAGSVDTVCERIYFLNLLTYMELLCMFVGARRRSVPTVLFATPAVLVQAVELH